MRYLLAVALFLATSPAAASDLDENPYTTLRQLPTPSIQEIDGEKLMCTTAKGWQKVMLIAVDYRGLYMWRLEIQGVLTAHDAIIQAYELKISSYEATIKTLQAERSYQKTRVGELETVLFTGGKSYKIEKMLMWGVILIETIAIGALGVASFVQAN